MIEERRCRSIENFWGKKGLSAEKSRKGMEMREKS